MLGIRPEALYIHARHSTNRATALTATHIFLNVVIEWEDRLSGIHNTVNTRSDLRLFPGSHNPLTAFFLVHPLRVKVKETKQSFFFFFPLCHKARLWQEWIEA